MFSINEPKKKKNCQNDSNWAPLPIPFIYDGYQNTDQFFKPAESSYIACIENRRISIVNKFHSEIFFNNGCFGKNEFSRRFRNCDSKNPGNEEFEYSFNIDSIKKITKKQFNHYKEWSLLKNDEQQASSNDKFNSEFLNEFVKFKTRNLESDCDPNKRYCRIDLEQKDCIGDERVNIMQSKNSPFCYRIVNHPDYILNEDYFLTYEEAFFLVFALDCLDVIKKSNFKNSISHNNLTINEIWETFLLNDQNFPYKYAVYHKLRSKGWILKCGLKYGCDFMAYYRGPEYYHASFGIRVKHIKIEDLSELLENESFTKLSAHIRINETVSKEMVLCYVIHDNHTDISTPACLLNMSILELLVNRWVPKENRI